jgi:hypothetical protein
MALRTCGSSSRVRMTGLGMRLSPQNAVLIDLGMWDYWDEAGLFGAGWPICISIITQDRDLI